MAHVSFNNAKLIPTNNSWMQASPAFLNLYGNGSGSGLRFSGVSVSNFQARIKENTSSKATLNYSGTFTTSGNDFYINWNDAQIWHITNISFVSGDDFDFDIDITYDVV